MGVKVEYYPEEIEMKMQAEREQLERMAQVEQEEEQQQKIDVVERDQQLLREKEQKEQKMVEEKAAAASAAASVASSASSAATTSTTAKIVVQPTQQVPPPPTLPSVQIAENTKQQPQTPLSPKINTEKEELIKILRDTSTTSKITKEVPPAISQVADTNNDDYMMSEVDQKQLQLFQVVGVGVLGAGLVNSITAKKTDEDDNNSSEGDNDPPLLPSSSTFEPSSPPLVKLKFPKPPSEPPIPPSDATLNKVLGLLEDDLQELNMNLELLENDLNELNTDLDSLQDEDGDSNLPSAGGAFATSVSNGSYLDSLPSTGSQFELKRSGAGFQSSYLARLGGAAPLQFDYSDTTTKMAEDYALTSDDQTSDASSDVDQYQIDEGEELPPTTDVAASATAAVSTGSYLDSLPDCNQSPTPPSFQSSNVPSAWRASAATVSKGSYLDSLPGGNQFELKRSGTGFQSSYLARLGGAAPLEFVYGDSSTTNASSDDQHQIDEAKELPLVPSPTSFSSSDTTYPATANAQRQIIETKSVLPPTTGVTASATAAVSTGSYLDSLPDGNQSPTPPSFQSSNVPSAWRASAATVSKGSYLDSLPGGNQFELKRSGTGFQSSYLARLGAAAPLQFDYSDTTTMEEDYASTYDNVDQTSDASSDQYQIDETEELPPTTDVTTSATAAVSTGSYLDSLPGGNQSPTSPSFQSSNEPSAWRASAATVSKGSYLDSLPGGNQFELKRSGTGFQSSYLARLGGAAPLQFDYGDSSTTNAPSETDQHQNDEAKEIPSLPPPLPFPSSDEMSPTEANSQRQIIDTESGLPPTDIASASTVSAGSYLASLAGSNQPLQSSYLGGLGGYLDSLSGSNQFGLKRSGTAFQSSYLGGLRAGAAPLEFRYVGSSPTLEEDYTPNYDNVDQRSYASPETDQYQNNEAEALPPVPPPQSCSSSDATSSTTSNAQRQMFQTSTGKRMRIDTDVVSDVNVDRAAPPFLRQSPTRLQMFGIKHPRGRHSTRLYMSQQSDEEESLFPSTDALIEVLRRQKMEKDRRDAEYRAQQQQEQRLADEEQRAREEAEQRAREEEERLRLEQEAKEDAALQMQLQMRMMAAERKAEEDRMMEQVLMEQKAKEEEAEKLRLQKEEVERLADERRQREEEEAKLREWEEKEERLLLEEKAKEEAEMKEFEERLVIEQRAKEEAELRARREEEERLQSEQRARDEAKLKQQQHEEEMRSRREKDQLLQIEQNMSYLNDALAQVDDRLGALNNDQSEAEVEYLDIDEGIQYLNSAVSEIDSLLSEGDDGY
eukprot:scaffold7523_cov124-Skeletonema_marinoi.AAC.1